MAAQKPKHAFVPADPGDDCDDRCRGTCHHYSHAGPCYEPACRHATPEPHPDTVRLDWLERNTLLGPDAGITVPFGDDPLANSEWHGEQPLREFIDSARGAAHADE